jgi:hypothetical protein
LPAFDLLYGMVHNIAYVSQIFVHVAVSSHAVRNAIQLNGSQRHKVKFTIAQIILRLVLAVTRRVLAIV